MQDLLPETDFRLFAVSARFPHNLSQQAALRRIGEGVYELTVVTLRIRVIVTNQLPAAEHNALLALFSTNEELLRYGKEHFQPQSKETSTLLYQLSRTYSEDPDMPNKLEEFVRQTIDELLAKLPAEERLKGLTPEERLEGLPAEERLKGLSAEERLEGLSPEELRLALEEAQRRLQTNGPSSKPQ
jgi:hypothetical protein